MTTTETAPPAYDKGARQQLEALAQGMRHVEVEMTDDVEAILDTLIYDRSCAYTNPVLFGADGRLKQTYSSARDGIREAYLSWHGEVGLRRFEPMSCISSSWYSFYHALVTVAPLKDDPRRPVRLQGTAGYASDVIVIFPTMGRDAITGELYWARRMDRSRGDPVEIPSAMTARRRSELGQRHAAYVKALRKADVDSLMTFYADDVQHGMRDYVADSGTILSSDGAAQLRSKYEQFFATFEPESIDVLQFQAGDWYFFSEQSWAVRDKRNGRRYGFRTVEYQDIETPDGRRFAHVGHGTDLREL